MNQAKVYRIALLNVPTILGIIIGLSTAAIASEPTRSDYTQQPSSIAQTPLNLEIPVPDAALETEELNPSATPETPVPSLELDARENQENQGMEQITNVSQLRDVSPGDWAYEAL